MTKPSDLKKDDNFHGRINKNVKKELKKLGVSAQDIVDSYINSVFKVDIKIVLKYNHKSKGEKGQ
jgi:hypothetical protein